jgi:hypothetical protein
MEVQALRFLKRWSASSSNCLLPGGKPPVSNKNEAVAIGAHVQFQAPIAFNFWRRNFGVNWTGG